MTQQSNRFNIDEKYLDKNLFSAENPYRGVKCYLSTSILPNFYHYTLSKNDRTRKIVHKRIRISNLFVGIAHPQVK